MMRTMKPVLYVIMALMMAGALEAKQKVAITKLLEHPSLSLIQSGILDTLSEHGYTKDTGTEIYLATAAGQITTAAQIAKNFAAKKPNLIIAITTPSAQAVHKVVRNGAIPLLFSGVTDPVGAHLLTKLDKSHGNTTGVYDATPPEKQLQLIKILQPTAQKIGILYNLGEQNAVKQVHDFEAEAKKNDLKVIKIGISKASEISQAAAKLVAQVDVFMLFNDNLVISSLQSILKITQTVPCPVFASDPESVNRGAFAAIAFDQYQMGKQAGLLAVEILKGTPIKDVLPQRALRLNVYVNAELIKALDIPPARVLKAKKHLNDPIGGPQTK